MNKVNLDTIKFHAIIEAQVLKIGYGSITFNIFLKDSIPIISTINIVRQKRHIYEGGKSLRNLIVVDKHVVNIVKGS